MELHGTVVTKRPPQDVFAFVSDFANIEQWDPGVVTSKKITPGPVGENSYFALSLRYFFVPVKMIYVITEFNPPHRVVLEGHGDTFSVVDTIEVRPIAQGAKVIYNARFMFSADTETRISRFGPLFDFIGKSAMKGMERALRVPTRPTRSVALFRARRNPLDRLFDRLIIPGLVGFTKWGHAIGQTLWKPSPSSLAGKTVVITGATSGIGRASAMELARKGARLVVVARNPAKAEETKKEIYEETGNRIELVMADLSLMSETINAAEKIKQGYPCIDVLINNAGALFVERGETSEGLEQSFAVNLLSPYLFTTRLLPALEKSKEPRIVSVSSGGMYTQKIVPDDLEMKDSTYDGPAAYARAKRGMVILTETWAAKYKHRPFAIHAMHPGWVDTPGLSSTLTAFYNALHRTFRTPQQGADTIVWLASSDEAGLCSGLFWLDRRPHTTHVFRHTRETMGEREKLRSMLKRYDS